MDSKDLIIIRSYLKECFSEFDITEDQSYRPFYHKFTVVKLQPPTSYKPQVSWPKIFDKRNAPAKIKRLLVIDDVAAR